MKNSLAKLKNMSSKEVDTLNVVDTSVLNERAGFPLMIKPNNYSLNLNNWIAENRDRFEKDLANHGAILFRGFKINTVERFQNLMKSFPSELLDYKMRSSPRHALTNNVYVSTTYPADQSINMHSESSYAPEHPQTYRLLLHHPRTCSRRNTDRRQCQNFRAFER